MTLTKKTDDIISDFVNNNIKKKQSKEYFFEEISKNMRSWSQIISFIYHQIKVEQFKISISSIKKGVFYSHYTIFRAIKTLESHQYLKYSTPLGMYEIINIPEWKILITKIYRKYDRTSI